MEYRFGIIGVLMDDFSYHHTITQDDLSDIEYNLGLQGIDPLHILITMEMVGLKYYKRRV